MLNETTLNSSYFIGFDEVHGWGNRTYFTFFSEFNRGSEWHGVLEAAVLSVLFILSLTGNVTIIAVILRGQKLRTITNYYICNLALADILFTAGCPMVAIVRISESWILGSFTCSLLVYMELVCGFTTIWTMTMISIDRYSCIVNGATTRFSLRSAMVTILAIWILILASFIPFALYFTVLSFPFGNTRVRICTLVWPRTEYAHVSLLVIVPLIVVGFIIPLLIISRNYYQIFKKLWKVRRTVVSSGSEPQLARTSSLSPSQSKYREYRDLKIVKTLALLVVLFVFMWMPIFVMFVRIQYDGTYDLLQLKSQEFIASLCVAFSNACVNPLVYGLVTDSFRHSLFDCIGYRRKNSGDLDRKESTHSAGHPHDKVRANQCNK